MTEPVDGWIRRAGERCIELGLPEVGGALLKHAKHEAGHHLLLVADTRLLVGRWNAHHPRTLDADVLMAQPATRAMRAYHELHESTIRSDMPYGQVAIELEIEGMSTSFGPRQLALCKNVLGPQALAGLSFIREHVALDVGHTVFNRNLMQQVLAVRPQSASKLAETGAIALRTYIDFFGECLAQAKADL
jgi:hypothetical protein